MYFKNKENTNIDNEFDKKKLKLPKFNFSSKSILLIVVGIIILVFGIIFFIKFSAKDRVSYYIELNGEELVTIYKGNEYIETGYVARDNKGNDLSDKVIIDSNVDVNVAGDYEIIYTLYDKTVKRYITVTDEPVGTTYMYLRGDSTIYLNIGEKYDDPGVIAIDSIDSNLDDKVVVYNKVDTSKKGTYQIVYTVTNSTGVTTSIKRTVIVMDGNISLTLDNEGYTNKEVGINIYIMDNYFDYLLLPDGTKTKEKSYTYKVSNNGEYKFISYNKTGKGTEGKITVSNIDREGPTGSCSGSYGNGKSNISVNAQDKAGIGKYVVDGNTYTSNNITINKEYSSVTVTVYDKVGNSNNITCNLSKKTTPAPSSSSSKPSSSNANEIDTSHYSVNNGIRNQDAVAINATDLGCTIVDGKFNAVSSINVNRAVSDNFHGILTNVCSYVKTVSWMNYLQHDGAFVSRALSQDDYHSKGLAIDLNDMWSFEYGGKTYSPYAGQGNNTWYRYSQFICNVCGGKEDCQYNINYVIFKRYFEGNGWCWGGNWSPSSFDPMHFELREGGCITKNKINVTCN